MNGFSTTVFPSVSDTHGRAQGGRELDSNDSVSVCPDGSGLNCEGYGSPGAEDLVAGHSDASGLDGDDENSELLRSFDMIFQLHQRSEEIRKRLDNIDRILLTSRTVAGLVETVADSLKNDLELTAVRVLFKEDHPLASAFEIETPANVGMIPHSLLENQCLFNKDPFILDHPSGDLGESLFGDAAPEVASAVIVTLCTETEEVGLLCLGSDDPQRYCGGMNTELIAALAEKISLGLQNSWDHEIRVRQALIGDVEGVYSEVFLKEYLRKEFQRSWRTYRSFSLMAVAWGLSYGDESSMGSDLVSLVKSNVRAADVVAEGETVNLWVLLPDTDLQGARTAAERITKCVGESPHGSAQFFVGVTAFSRDAVTAHMLMRQAKIALAEAIEADQDRVVAMPMELG